MFKRENITQAIYDFDSDFYAKKVKQLIKNKENAKLVAMSDGKYLLGYPIKKVPHLLVTLKDTTEAGMQRVTIHSASYGFIVSPIMDAFNAKEAFDKLEDFHIDLADLQTQGWLMQQQAREQND